MRTNAQDDTENVDGGTSEFPWNPEDDPSKVNHMNNSECLGGRCEEDAIFDIHPTIPASIISALNGFRRDLPEPLKKNYRKWVAYNSRGERIAIGKPERKLYLQCVGQGLHSDEFIVRCVFPELEEITDELIDV